MKTKIFGIIALMILLIVSTGSLALGADKYSSSYLFESACMDSTGSQVTETDSLVGTNLAPIFYWTDFDGSTIAGVGECYIYAMDSTTCGAAATTPDTTGNDTVYLIILTAWNSVLTGNATGYARSGETVIDTVIFTSMTSGTAGIQAVGFEIPSTAPIGDVVYGRIKNIYWPAVLADTVTIDYKVGISMTAR